MAEENQTEPEMAESYKLVYFDARGIGESVRLIFKVAEVPFEDIRVDENEKPVFGSSEPGVLLGHTKSSLPILQVGGHALGKSGVWGNEISLCRYLARKFGLIGENEIDAARCDKVVEDLFALRSAVILLVIQQTHDLEHNRAGYLEKFQSELMPVFIGSISGTLDQNGGEGWLVGNKLTWADVLCAYTMEFIGNLVGEDQLQKALHKFPNLEKHYSAVYDLPSIRAWTQIRPEAKQEVEHVLKHLM